MRLIHFSLFFRLDYFCWLLFKFNNPFFSDSNLNHLLYFLALTFLFGSFSFSFFFHFSSKIPHLFILTLFYFKFLHIFVIAVWKIFWLIPISGSSLVIFLWTAFSLNYGSYFPASSASNNFLFYSGHLKQCVAETLDSSFFLRGVLIFIPAGS